MRKITSFLVFLLYLWGIVWPVRAQVILPQVRLLTNQGWSIQHSTMSADSLSIYFSAKEPSKPSYDVYVMHIESWRWGAPEPLTALNSELDECWPSVSSDEASLYFVRHTPPVHGDKHSFEKTTIYRALNKDGLWAIPEPIIISGEEDNMPTILEDNTTLLFQRRQESKKHDGPWESYSAEVLDDHNWSLPQLTSTTPRPKPVLIVSGTTVMEQGGRPIPSGRVEVYDALTRQRVQTARVHPMTGRWTIILRKGNHYRLDITADGYSHQYKDFDTQSLSRRQRTEVGNVALDNKLSLLLRTYDAETQEVLSETKQNIRLGERPALTLSHKAYRDTTLVINTERPMCFTATELDVPLQPLKSPHRFLVSDSKTGQQVNATLSLDGRPIEPNTALRIDQKRMLQVTAKGYLLYDSLIYTGTDTRERTMRISLVPIEKDLVLQLRNIQFEYDSYELTPASNRQLEQLQQLMTLNPTLRIELSAHTDDRGLDKYNDRLSSLRAQAVIDWLAQKGMDTKRIEAKGYGKRKPLVPNDSEANRALNRRVEFKVTDY